MFNSKATEAFTARERRQFQEMLGGDVLQVRNLNGRGINEAKHNSTIRLHLPDPQIG